MENLRGKRSNASSGSEQGNKKRRIVPDHEEVVEDFMARLQPKEWFKLKFSDYKNERKALLKKYPPSPTFPKKVPCIPSVLQKRMDKGALERDNALMQAQQLFLEAVQPLDHLSKFLVDTIPKDRKDQLNEPLTILKDLFQLQANAQSFFTQTRLDFATESVGGKRLVRMMHEESDNYDAPKLFDESDIAKLKEIEELDELLGTQQRNNGRRRFYSTYN